MAKKSARSRSDSAGESSPETPANGQPGVEQPDDRQLPAHVVRYGKVKATIWANQTDRGIFYAVNIVRIYRQEGTNEWAQTASLGRDDLLPAAEAARDAWAWIHAQMQGGEVRS